MGRGNIPPRLIRGLEFERVESLSRHRIASAEVGLDAADSWAWPKQGAAPMTGSKEPNRKGQLGDFEIVREIGRGGMGIVYEARQVSLNRKVALKVLVGSLGLSLTSRAVAWCRREAAVKLQHSNIVRARTTGDEDATQSYAMELVTKQTYGSLVQSAKSIDLCLISPGGILTSGCLQP